MVVVINYGMGNLGSIMNMLKKVGADTILSSNPADVVKADKLILPGVGAFDSGMKNLGDSGLIAVLNHKVIENKTPILGVCLGMQLFTKKSEEGNLAGLGWIDAETVKFKFDDIQSLRNKIPHMGWNTVEITQKSWLFNDMYPEPRFYFLHSYYVRCNDTENILTKTFHGHSFVSSIIKDNITGVQFHPEKSHKFGMKLLSNFVRFA
jgi:glutamine amidotransferase